MKTEGVEEGGKTLHDTETAGPDLFSARLERKEEEGGDVHRDGKGEPHGKHGDEEEDGSDSLHLERTLDRHVPKDLGELSVREGQRPETEVGSGVGDATEAELDRVCKEEEALSDAEREKREEEEKRAGDVRMTW